MSVTRRTTRGIAGMGREVRRVALDFEPPRDDKGDLADRWDGSTR